MSPEEAVSEYRRRYKFQDVICADITSFYEKATYISVNGDSEPFCASGHYPVLAFSDDQSSVEGSEHFRYSCLGCEKGAAQANLFSDTCPVSSWVASAVVMALRPLPNL